jgi:glycosyltransferase involved in cell wall biosynthesis
MPRILIDCRYLNGRPSGIGEMVVALATHLPRQAPDLDFTLLTSPAAPQLLSKDANVTCLQVAAPVNGPGTMWFMPRMVDLGDIDLFHAPANILPAGLTMPTVTTIHDLMWLEHPEWCSPGLLHPVRKAFFAGGIRRALRRSTAIAAISDATGTAITRQFPDAEMRTHVTLSGVSEDFAPVQRNAGALAGCGLDPERRYILVVGQFAPYKNHDGAIRAFAAACRTIEDIDLVLVQRQGPSSAALLKLSRKLGIGDRVRFTGPVERVELIQLYSSAAFLLHPSLCEGFGNPVLEAMACGCPVITSSISAMPEVAGGAALLADPHDTDDLARQIIEVLGDDGLAQDLRRRGHARAKEMRWERFAEANLSIYRRVLGKQKAS